MDSLKGVRSPYIIIIIIIQMRGIIDIKNRMGKSRGNGAVVEVLEKEGECLIEIDCGVEIV